jgi:hypothetical protein
MKTTYEEVTSESGNKYIKATDETGLETWIPVSESNADYQRYLNPEADQPIGGNK